MNLYIEKNIRDNQKLRESFMELAITTFDLSFANWYKGGYWTRSYIPYAFTDGDKIAANASVNIIDTVWQNQPKRYIQIGTVMTDAAYRNRGLSSCLIEEILKDWTDQCDCIYLFANDSVLDFYPKFGFQKEREYQHTMPITAKRGNKTQLTMSNAADRDFLQTYYAKGNPFSALPMLDNYGLLMFSCSTFLKDCILYCQELDAVVIAMQSEETLICFDIYCNQDKSLYDIIAAVSSKETKQVIFEFTPKDTKGCMANAVEDEDKTLFVLKNKDNIFTQNKVMFPSLSHA